MAEYIEREALIQNMQECKGDSVFNIMATGYAFSFIENAPAADVVEVVRCKNCKHSKESIGNDGIIICNIDGETDEETGIDYGFVTYYSENHFCGYGERKCEDGKNNNSD